MIYKKIASKHRETENIDLRRYCTADYLHGVSSHP